MDVRSWLCFDEKAWDLFFVYEADLIREVKSITTDGLQVGELQLQPFGDPFNADFGWSPDGLYIGFVRVVAILFVVFEAAVRGAPMPDWLVQDFLGIRAVFTKKSSLTDRALSGLKASILASKQNRAIDPILVDHMLVNCGMGNEASSNQFIERYHASVKYDPSLMLKEQAARRQSNLLDPLRCSPEMKEAIRQAVNAADSFEATGLTLEIMSLPEFWIGHKFVSTSHAQWVKVGTTTPESCLLTLKVALSTFGRCAGKKGGSAAFRDLARRIAFFVNLSSGVFARKNVASAILARFEGLVKNGTYDEDIDGLINSCDEDVGEAQEADMDKYLVEVCTLVQDVLESQEANAGKNEEDQARVEAAVGMDDSEWFLAEVDHDIKAFRKIRAERLQKAEALSSKEKEYSERVRRNVAEATSGFSAKHVPMLETSHDDPAFWNKIKKELDDHAKRIAQEFSCDVGNVLRVAWVDMWGAQPHRDQAS